MTFKGYHKIKQFRDVIRDIQFKANFKGLNEKNEPIYEESKKPVITFKGTIKLHGTNAGVCYSPTDGIKAQTKSHFVGDNLQSHFEFSRFVNATKKDFFEKFMSDLYSALCQEGEQITVYGEWAGSGIQKSVAISDLPKSFYIFDCKVFNPSTNVEKWIDVSKWLITEPNIYNIHDFETYTTEIDFNNPGLVQNTLVDITIKVEDCCPVSKKLGVEGVGEGVVWSANWNGEKYIFKVKGEKHSASRVRTLAEVDPEKLKGVSEFLDYAVTTNRIEQGIQEVGAKEKSDMPALLKWVGNDIMLEEADVMANSNLEWKTVAKEVNNRVRQHYFEYLNKIPINE